MKTAELKILATDIPQLAEIVAIKRMESLTAYPLARLCEWSAPRRKPRLDTGNDSNEEGQD